MSQPPKTYQFFVAEIASDIINDKSSCQELLGDTNRVSRTLNRVDFSGQIHSIPELLKEFGKSMEDLEFDIFSCEQKVRGFMKTYGGINNVVA